MPYTIFIANEATALTKNLHLEHPEDQILTGDRSVLDWFEAPSHVSMKMDGAPAIVWGTNPENGRFFVGTKSVFNKVKVKINYDAEDILFNHGSNDNVVDILLACLDYLPRTEGIFQGDFIGFGGQSAYKPNTIIYDFVDEVEAKIIMAPHTVYTGDTIKTMAAAPLQDTLESTPEAMFVQPTVDSLPLLDSAALVGMESLFSEANFLTPKEAAEVRIIVNTFIREGKPLTHEVLSVITECETLARIYLDIISLKEKMMENIIVYDGPTAFADGEVIVAEGFVRSNKYGTMKLVDRTQFSRINFNNQKFA